MSTPKEAKSALVLLPGCALFLCMTLGGSYFLWASLTMFTSRRTEVLRTVDLGDGYELELLVVNDWETGDFIDYRILNGVREITQQTFVTGHRRDSELNLATVLSRNGSVAVIHQLPMEEGNTEMFIMFDKRTEKSWPRDRPSVDDEEGKESWMKVYREIADDYPDLPAPDFFKEPRMRVHYQNRPEIQ